MNDQDKLTLDIDNSLELLSSYYKQSFLDSAAQKLAILKISALTNQLSDQQLDWLSAAGKSDGVILPKITPLKPIL